MADEQEGGEMETCDKYYNGDNWFKCPWCGHIAPDQACPKGRPVKFAPAKFTLSPPHTGGEVIEGRAEPRGEVIPVNAQIANALGWKVWESQGKWFMESVDEIRLVPDYISILRLDVKMHVPRQSPADRSEAGRGEENLGSPASQGDGGTDD